MLETCWAVSVEQMNIQKLQMKMKEKQNSYLYFHHTISSVDCRLGGTVHVDDPWRVFGSLGIPRLQICSLECLTGQDDKSQLVGLLGFAMCSNQGPEGTWG